MKKNLKILFFILLLIFSYNAFANENKILIKVDNEIITSYDILVEISYLKAVNKNLEKLDYQQSIVFARNSLIREKIKEITLKQYVKDIKLNEDELNKILINYFSSYGITSINSFNEYFLAKKIDPKIIKNKIELEIIWNQFIYSKYNNKVKINKNLIKKEVKENSKQKQYFLSEILFEISDNENLENKFDKIKTEIVQKGFAETALKYSISDTAKNGGRLGWVKNSVLSKEIKEKLASIKVGNLTTPITIPGGFLILKIEDLKLIENDLNLDKEINYVIKKKSEQQLNQFSNIFLKKVRKDIQINEL